MPDFIKLPSERLIQLKTLADKLGVSVTDTIGHLIRQEIAKGTIPDTVPGFTIKVSGKSITVAIDEGHPSRLTPGAAIALADHIDGLIAGKGDILNLDINFAVVRVGTGIKIHDLSGGSNSRVVSRDVARDIAGVLRRTVTAAATAHAKA